MAGFSTVGMDMDDFKLTKEELKVARYIVSRLNMDYDEVSTEVLLGIWRARRTYDDSKRCEYGKYVLWMIRHKLCALNRANRRIKRQMHKYVPNEWFDRIEDNRKSAGRLEVVQLIDSLPRKYRLVTRMVYIDGLNNEQIASKLKVSYRTVRSKRNYGLYLMQLLFRDNTNVAESYGIHRRIETVN